MLALGQKLVNEFGGASQADTLSQWMAHHLAERLAALKAASGPRKQQLEQECRDSILQIWKHRASFPYDHRPFKNFDAVFRTLESLDPAKERNRYVHLNMPGQTRPESQPDPVQAWLDAATSVDRGARALIRAYLDSAVAAATKGKDDWIKAVRALVQDDEADVQIIVRIIDKIEEPEEEPEPVELERRFLVSLRENLLDMVKGAAEVVPVLNRQIMGLEIKTSKKKSKRMLEKQRSSKNK